MELPFYIYEGGPIDDFLGTLTREDVSGIATSPGMLTEAMVDEALTGFDQVAAYMSQNTNNHMRQDILMFSTPGEDTMIPCFLAKLNTKGTTYVFTKEKLDYLVRKCGFTLVESPTD